MRKIFISLFTAILLFSACSSDEDPKPEAEGRVGSLELDLTLVGQQAKAVLPIVKSKAIPVTTWSNITQAYLYLYKADGTVVYWRNFNPASTNGKFVSRDIPEGIYHVGVVANADSRNCLVDTYVDNIKTEFGERPVGHKLGTTFIDAQARMDLKELDKSAFPEDYLAYTEALGINNTPFAQASEIFTANLAGTVEIKDGETTNLSPTPLMLKREISLMRLRVRIDEDIVDLTNLDFENPKNSILIQQNPEGLGLAYNSFDGGIFSERPSLSKRVMVVAQGSGAYLKANPTTATHYIPGAPGAAPDILTGDFKYWREAMVLPNAARSDNKTSADNADKARQYDVILGVMAKPGYVLDGKTLTEEEIVYWTGTITGVFEPNVVREVNLTIKTAGGPPIVQKFGDLEIQVEAPIEWLPEVVETKPEI